MEKTTVHTTFVECEPRDGIRKRRQWNEPTTMDNWMENVLKTLIWNPKQFYAIWTLKFLVIL